MPFNRYFSFNILFLLFILSLTFGNVFYEYVGFNYVDEIIVFGLCLYYFLFKIKNGFTKTDYPLIVFFIISILYLIYSFGISVNVFSAILVDYQQQIKPFITFYCTYSLFTTFSKVEKKRICMVSLTLFCVILYVVFTDSIELFFKHVTNFASAIIVLSYTYYFFSSRSKRNLALTLIMLSVGLLSFRSKFYGEYVFSIGILIFLNKKISFSFRTLFFFFLFLATTFYFAWDKIDYYFIQGATDDSIARPVLYRSALQILNDYIPFGPGFGTFGNEASRLYYSPLYSQYQIDEVWGLSRDFDRFVADTYYPTLSQFGYLGVLLFLFFMMKLYKKITAKIVVHKDVVAYKIGLLIFIFFVIESVADSTFVSNRAVGLMMLLSFVLKSSPLFGNYSDK